MLRSEAITIIKRGLGLRQTQDPTIIAALQAAQRNLENGRTLPTWLATSVNVAMVAGTHTYDLTGLKFLRLREDMLPYYTTPSSDVRVTVPVLTYQEAYETFISNSTDPDEEVDPTGEFPRAISFLTPTQIYVTPTPNSATTATITINGYFAAVVLDSDVENAWLLNAPEYLIGQAGMDCAMVVRDKDALTRFTAMRNEGYKSFMGKIIDTELQGRPLIMGRNV